MADVAKLLKQKNWNMTIIIVLLIIVGSLVPLSVSWAVDRSVKNNMAAVVTEAMQEQMIPIISMLEDIDDKVDSLEKAHNKEVLLSGIAAFNKFSGYSGDALIEALEINSQNRVRLQIALENKDARAILMQTNKEVCEFFLEYFDIE